MTFHILEDMHVHSRFSDGQATVEENVQQALRRGLTRMCCVDHVRRDTTWVPEFVAEIRRVQQAYGAIQIACGLEAKILDQAGNLDLPPAMEGADYVFAADHRFPLGDSCLSPQEVRDLVRQQALTPEAAISCLVEATTNALINRPGLVLAHLFSILPKAGLSEDNVTDAQLAQLARVARRTGASIEVDERWHCPSLRTTRPFHEAGVPVFCSSDSHRLESVGEYNYVRRVWASLHESISN